MPKASDVLKFRDGGLSVEEARKAMLEAGEAPSGVKRETKKNVASGFESELPAGAQPPAPPEPPVAPPEPPVAPPEPPVAPPSTPPAAAQPTRIETEQFIGEIRQEGGKWVAELRYKLGGGLAPGSEKFTAPSKNELMIELLRGKGHATLRVKKAVRRERLGRELDRSYPLPTGMSVDEFKELSEKQQERTLDQIAVLQAYEFKEKHPEFLQTEENGAALIKFLHQEGLPVTVRNLEYAFEELDEDGLLERPEQKVSAQPTEPTPAGDSPAVQPVTEKPSAPPAEPPSAAIAGPGERVVAVRKRGTTGLQPGQSSAPSDASTQEDGNKPKELSEAELRKLPLSELRRIAYAERQSRAGSR